MDCEDDFWITLTFPVGIRNPDVVFDYSIPGGLLSGEMKARFALFGANVVLRTAKTRNSTVKPYIMDVNFWSTDGFKVTSFSLIVFGCSLLIRYCGEMLLVMSE